MTTNTNDAPSLGEELRTAGDRYWGKPKERAAFECGVAWGFHKGLEYAALPEQAAVPPGLKDHEVALLVNRLRDIAMNFHGTQQLRERIAAEIRPAAHALAAAPKAEPVPAGGDASPSAASAAWNSLRALTDPLGEAGVKIMGHVRIYAQRQYEAGKEEADRAMLAQAAPSEWDVRGRLAASLTCWHRLTGQEAAELVALFQGHPAQASPQPAVQQGDALTYEREHAIRQAHEIGSSDAYFNARPQIDNNDRRKVFAAGFERGWDAARSQAKEGA